MTKLTSRYLIMVVYRKDGALEQIVDRLSLEPQSLKRCCGHAKHSESASVPALLS